MALGILLFTIFLLLSLLHFSWAMGSIWGFEVTIPKKENGDWAMNPSKKDSFIVGLGLLLFAVFYLVKIQLLFIPIPEWAMSIASWLIPIIFLLRSVGDFKYVGFFKKITSTDFAKKDSKIYSPLCLILALIGFIVELA